MSQSAFYEWNVKFSGMGVLDAPRLKSLEAENTLLKKLLAEHMRTQACSGCTETDVRPNSDERLLELRFCERCVHQRTSTSHLSGG